jgi:ATP-dependent Clp protease ATP-binding subunit ClpX
MENHLLSCTFCKRSEKQVRELVAGPGVCICDRCTVRAHAIIREGQPPRMPFLHRVKLRLSRLTVRKNRQSLHRVEGHAV